MPLNKAAPGFSFKKNGKGKTVFITGGAGRIGRNLIRALQRDGYEVRVLAETKDFMSNMPSGVIPYVGDIGNKKVLMEGFKGVDTVYHLAAIVSEYKAHTNELMRVNVQGTAAVLEACRASGVGHLVFASTVDVYGSNRKDILNEDSRLKPTDKYGYSKMLAEREVEKYADKLDYTIFRMAAIYGKEFAASYFKVFKAIKEQKAYLIGDGNNHLALVHIDDVVNAFILADSNRKSSRMIYNLSDGVSYTQQQLFATVAKMLNVDPPTRHISPIVVKLLARSRNLDSDELRFIMSNRLIDIAKLKKELGFKPTVDIKDGAMELVKEFLKKGPKYKVNYNADLMMNNFGKTEKYIYERLEQKGALMFMLIDPVDYKTPDEAIKTAKEAEEGGADLILVGGSIGAQGELLDYVMKGLKEKISSPVVLFPGNIATLSRYADAVYFMSLLNARTPYWITHAQMLSAPLVKQLKIEPLPVGYIVVAPGGTVGWVGDVNLVPREKTKIAASLALAGEYLGNHFIITDVGSNPQLQGQGPVPPEMIKAVKSTISVPYIVAGGIRTTDDLRTTIKAGADIVQIGTAIEQSSAARKQAESFSKVVKEEGIKRVRK